MQITTATLCSFLAALGLANLGCRAFEPTTKQRSQPRPESYDPLASGLPDADTAASPRADPEPRIPDPVALAGRAHVSGDARITLELRGVTLAEALYTVGQYADVNLVLGAGLDEVVDASFPSITVDDALDVLLDQQGLRLIESQPGVFSVVRADGGQAAERRFYLRSARAADVEANLKALIRGGSQIVLDGEQNFVYVRGTQADIDAVERYLDLADRVREQVLVEVRIAEIKLDANFELGLQHILNDLEVGSDTLSLVQDLSTPANAFELTLQTDDGDLMSTLNALERYVGLELVSAPRIVAVNNTVSTIDIVREVPYIKTSTEVSSGTTGGVGTSVSQEVAFKEVGLKLKVKPIIRQGGLVELEVDQELSEVASFLLGVPAVDKRHVVSRLQIQDRHTLVIGGLMQDRSSRTDEGVPGLTDLPLLGRLFRSDQDTDEKRELLIFLTPRILSPGDVAGVSNAWREQYRARQREMGVGVAPAK